MEADFQAHYGLDLRRVVYGPRPIGVRRLLALVRGLPPKGAFHRAVDPEGWHWDQDTEFLASLLDSMSVQMELFWRANFTVKPPKMTPIERPHSLNEDNRPRGTTMGELRQMATPTVVPKD